MNIDDLLAKLQAHLVSLGDGRDTRSDNERAAWWATSTETQKTISVLMNAPAHVARWNEQLTDLEGSRAAWLGKQTEISELIAACPDLDAVGIRERDKEYERQSALQMQLQRLRDGTLHSGPGTTFGQLGAIEARIAELTERRDSSQRALDGALAQAERLLNLETTVTP